MSKGNPFFLCFMFRPCQLLKGVAVAACWAPLLDGLLVTFILLLDKDLQLPSGFNCNFDFPEEPCGWMYDHAKWLRSTWIGSASPNDRTFPGKAAETSYERWKASLLSSS